MIRQVLALFLFSCSVLTLSAQSSYKGSKSLMISAGGEGGIYTLAYERLFSSRKTIRPFVRTGFSLFPVDQRITLVVPVSCGALYQSPALDVSFGIGMGPSVSHYSFGGSAWRFYSRLFMETGIRHYFKMNKYSIGLRYTPLISFIESTQYEHWGAVTFGIHFQPKK